MSSAFIYIMTNKTFSGHNWVKIGYATNVEKRRKQLSTTNIPYPYEVYATYEIPESQHLGDNVLHKLITNLNPNLRLTANREFFEMTPEQAFDLLKAIAVIHNREDKLVLHNSKIDDDMSGSKHQTIDNSNAKLTNNTNSTDNEFYCTCKGNRSTLTIGVDDFTLKAGSIIRINLGINNPECKAQEQDIKNGILVDNNSGFGLLKRDKAFKKPSGAAKYALGYSVNGWIAWKNAKGQTLKEFFENK